MSHAAAGPSRKLPNRLAPHPLLALVSGYEVWIRRAPERQWELRLDAVRSRLERNYGRHVAETVLTGLRIRLRRASG